MATRRKARAVAVEVNYLALGVRDTLVSNWGHHIIMIEEGQWDNMWRGCWRMSTGRARGLVMAGFKVRQRAFGLP
ncbi:hypothetical protein M0R45_008368 [Rubus argutus]|uniref:Uncharacterized protein n=1 Tax=Rubus argutus TaxID=59490 RepID=A0AAW1Y488_RUBAR